MTSVLTSIPEFGDRTTADVILKLIPLQNNGLPIEPLFLHSKVLRRCEFFEARLSLRWSVEGVSCSQPLELTLDKCKNPHVYVRCIHLLYLPNKIKSNFFSDAQDVLDILEVAAELLFHECIDACMKYLDSIPWNAENETNIRTLFKSLHIKPTSDLAARLSMFEDVSNFKPVDIMKNILGELLTLVTNGAPTKTRNITRKVLLGNNVMSLGSSSLAAVNEIILLKELHKNVEQLKVQLRKFANFCTWNSHQVNLSCSTIQWLLEEMFTLQFADAAVQMLVDEQELAQLMVCRCYQNPVTETLFFIFLRVLQGLQNGNVSVSKAIRLSLLTTWLPVIAKLGNDGDDNFKKKHELQQDLEKGLNALVHTLPIIDQEGIFKIWITSCLCSRRAWPDLSQVFDVWCDKLREAQRTKDNTNFLLDNTNMELTCVETNIEKDVQIACFQTKSEKEIESHSL